MINGMDAHADRPAAARRRGRPPKAEARGAVLRALRSCIADFEYDEIAVEDIIRRSGISRATFYKHFQNKDDALVALFSEVARDIRLAVLAAFARPGTIDEMLDAAATAYVQRIIALGKLAPVFNASQYRFPRMFQEREETLRTYVAEVSGLIERSGLPPVPALLLDALFAGVDRLAQQLAAARAAGRDTGGGAPLAEIRFAVVTYLGLASAAFSAGATGSKRRRA